MADNKPTDEEFFDDELEQDGLSERLDDLDEELAIARAASLRAGLDDYDLDEEDFELLDTVTEDPDKITYLPALPVLAVVGRPNVGKSSLLNKAAGEERVVVNDLAGTTRDPVDEQVEIAGKVWRFVDTAGIRRKMHRVEGADFYASLRTATALERAEVAVVLFHLDENMTY